MASSRVFIVLGLLIAFVLLISSHVVAKEEKAKEVDGVNDAKYGEYPGGGNGGYPGGGNNGGYPGGPYRGDPGRGGGGGFPGENPGRGGGGGFPGGNPGRGGGGRGGSGGYPGRGGGGRDPGRGGYPGRGYRCPYECCLRRRSYNRQCQNCYC